MNQLLTEDALIKAQDEFGEDAFSAGIGAEAVREILIGLDLKKEQKKLRAKKKNRLIFHSHKKTNLGLKFKR